MSSSLEKIWLVKTFLNYCFEIFPSWELPVSRNRYQIKSIFFSLTKSKNCTKISLKTLCQLFVDRSKVGIVGKLTYLGVIYLLTLIFLHYLMYYKKMHAPGVEPGSERWQRSILPLNYACYYLISPKSPL
jgi:hypothetical protein